MKGRGTRIISPTDLNAVTPDSQHKTHFVIVDAIGVCEKDKTDSRPLERKRTVPFDKLLLSVATGKRDDDTLTSLAGRLARLDKQISDRDREVIQEAADGKDLKELINGLLDAVDPDKHLERAREIFQTEQPTEDQLKEASEKLVEEACNPFDDANLRNKIIEIKTKSEQTLDIVSPDKVLFAGFDKAAKERAESIVESFKKFIDENKDEITALQIFYSKPYGQRHVTFSQVKELAEAIEKPPNNLTPELLWKAYEQLDKAKVRGAGPQKLLTNIISLVRFSLGEIDVLEPFTETIDKRFEDWLAQQESIGRKFSDEQLEWLSMIKEHVATSLTIEMEDFEYAPFHDKGGQVKVYQLFGEGLNEILDDLNGALAA